MPSAVTLLIGFLAVLALLLWGYAQWRSLRAGIEAEAAVAPERASAESRREEHAEQVSSPVPGAPEVPSRSDELAAVDDKEAKDLAKVEAAERLDAFVFRASEARDDPR